MVGRRLYLSQLFEKCPCEFHLLQKKDCIHACQRTKNALKRNYLETTLERHKHHPKKLWRDIYKFWPSLKNQSAKINFINGESDDETKANNLNDDFSNIASKI